MPNSTSKPRVALGLCLVATLVAFWPITGAGFLDYDDFEYVSQNKWVQSGLTYPGFLWAFRTGFTGNWHPVTWLSHMLDCQLFGLDPRWHHVVNLVLHLVNTFLLYFFLERVTRNGWKSVVVASLFALHPLHVESVAWISERKDLLSTCLLLLALHAYVRYTEMSPGCKESVEGRESRVEGGSAAPPAALGTAPLSTLGPRPVRWTYFVLVLLLFALSLMAKPMGVTFPFLLILLDYWPLERFGSRELDHSAPLEATRLTRRRFVFLFCEKLPLLALSVVSCVITVVVQRQEGALALSDQLPLGARLANAAVSYCRYLAKTIWPVRLATFYPYAAQQLWPCLACVALLVGITVAVYCARRRQPYLLVGWLWFVGTLVPAIGIVQVGLQSMADRYTYLPLVGLFLMLAWAGGEIAEHRPRVRIPMGAAAIIAAAACALLTVTQAGYWKNTLILFEHSLAVTGENAPTRFTLGIALAKAGQLGQAELQFNEAIRIAPDFGKAHVNLGLLLLVEGRTDDGVAELRKAIETPNMDTAELREYLGSALAKKGDSNEAIAEYKAALALDPTYLTARLNLCRMLLQQGKTGEATLELRAATQSSADCWECHWLLGQALERQGNSGEALDHLTQAARLNPTNVVVHCELAACLERAGKTREAMERYRQALAMDPKAIVALNNLAWILATDPNPELRNGEDAVRLAETACELTGYRAAVLVGTLSTAYAESGQYDQAVSTARRAEELATAAGQPEIARRNREMSELFLKQQPFHQTRNVESNSN